MKLLHIAASLAISIAALFMVNSVYAQPAGGPVQRYAPPPVIDAPAPRIAVGWHGSRYWDGRRYWSRNEWYRRHSHRHHHAHGRRGPGRSGPHR